MGINFLCAPTHFNNRLCPSVRLSIGNTFVRRSPGRAYWPTWPGFDFIVLFMVACSVIVSWFVRSLSFNQHVRYSSLSEDVLIIILQVLKVIIRHLSVKYGCTVLQY